jgi:hypothetical protein
MEKLIFEKLEEQSGTQIETDIVFMFPELEPKERILYLQQYGRAKKSLYQFYKLLPEERQSQLIEFMRNPKSRNSRNNANGHTSPSNMLEIKKVTHSGIHNPALFKSFKWGHHTETI